MPVKPSSSAIFQNSADALPTVSELVRLRSQVRKWKLTPKQQAAGPAIGQYRSRFKGRGMEFEEVRNYQAGDDIRHMDWKVTARTGLPHIKLFREERERPVYLAVDYSPGMFFGTRVCFKSVLAARIATLLAWSAMDNHDRVGALIFSGNRHQETRPESGKLGVIRLINAVTDPSHLPVSDIVTSVALHAPLQRLRHVAKPGSLIFVLSDFRGVGADTENYVARLRQHCEVVFVHISDPLEERLPPPGSYAISDGRDIHMLDCASDNLQRLHTRHFQEHQQHMRELSKKFGISYAHVRTSDEDIPGMLRRFLHSRAVFGGSL